MDELDRLIALVNGVFSSIELAVVCRDRPVMAEWKDKMELRYLQIRGPSLGQDDQGTYVVCSL
jgi:hypothetical protein